MQARFRRLTAVCVVAVSLFTVALGAAPPPDLDLPQPEFPFVQRAIHRTQSARAPPADSLRA